MNPSYRIKELRLKNGLTQIQLAEESGMTLRTIQRIENNKVKPSLFSLKKLSKILGEDFSNVSNGREKPYEITFTIKLHDMNQLIQDIKTLVKNNWKILAVIVVALWFFGNYTDIKAGIIDGWNNR
ncbi:MAG: helix-turn-helix domain-containing protein [Cyclobacteriaceae bacterium]